MRKKFSTCNEIARFATSRCACVDGCSPTHAATVPLRGHSGWACAARTSTHSRGEQPFFSYPRRLGHELCVEIISAPADSGLRAGDLCAVEAYYFCGTCPACRAGKTNCCKNLKVLGVHIDGGHAPLMSVPADKLHRANKLKPEQIALVEPLVIGAHGVERAAPKKDEPVVIVGMGPIGLAAAIFPKPLEPIWSVWMFSRNA